MIYKKTNILLKQLNLSQKKVVERTEGPLLVLAGAGTGKTKTLITRLAYILDQGLASLDQILAVTFTNRATKEMKERLTLLLGDNVNLLSIGTFHSLGLRILRRYHNIISIDKYFTILDLDDQARIIKQILEDLSISKENISISIVVKFINTWKDRGIFPCQINSNQDEILINIYKKYEEKLKLLNIVDFSDLILLSLKLLQENDNILHKYQDKYYYFLVDEFQDTNVLQYLWLRTLSKKYNNLCCVGDDDQSIYGWRGAELSNILRFDQDFMDAKIIRLEQNYRSTSKILMSAVSLITNNNNRLGKKLWTALKTTSFPVVIKETWDSESEAKYVVGEIQNFKNSGGSLSNIAILVRASFQIREFEEKLLSSGIPYVVIGGNKFYERQEIKDIVAYLRIILQHNDALAFERIVNVPTRGIGEKTLQLLFQLSSELNCSLPISAIILIKKNKLKPKSKKSLFNFLESLDFWRNLILFCSPQSLIKYILKDSRYIYVLKEENTIEALARIENIKELLSIITEFQSILEFLEYISLVTEKQEELAEFVTIVTIHKSKGLEFNYVFLVGWSEGLFPNSRSLNESGTFGLEEERRLAYVALTRAKNRVVITFSLNRFRYDKWWQPNIPSRFLLELPFGSISSNLIIHSISK